MGSVSPVKWHDTELDTNFLYLIEVSYHGIAMRSQQIQKLIDEVQAAHGVVTLYGSDPFEEHGTCFRLTDIPATFSVHTQEGTLPSGQYDIQIEGMPPGDYIYTSVVPLGIFLKLITKVQGPQENWPVMGEGDS